MKGKTLIDCEKNPEKGVSKSLKAYKKAEPTSTYQAD